MDTNGHWLSFVHSRRPCCSAELVKHYHSDSSDSLDCKDCRANTNILTYLLTYKRAPPWGPYNARRSILYRSVARSTIAEGPRNERSPVPAGCFVAVKYGY